MRSRHVVTNLRCNQNCRYCTARRAADDPAFIRAEAVRARITAAVAEGADEIILSGGEPTMRADLAALIAHARASGARVAIETNATLVDAARAAELAAAGLGLARVNLAGVGDALDEVTRDPGGFARTVAGLVALRDAGVSTDLQVAITRSTRELVAELPERLAERIGVHGLGELRVVVPIESPDPTEPLPFDEAAAAIMALDASARRAGLPVRMSPEPGPPPCVFPREARAAHLYALTRGGGERPGFARVPACAACLVADRCPGMPAAYLARHAPPPLEPIRDDRARRRLSVISTVAEQVDREFVQANRAVQAGAWVDEEIIRVVFHCNQACRFCFVSTHLPAAADARIDAAIRAAGARGAKIVLSGGEPTLHPRLADWIALAHETSRHPVMIQTNAVRLDDPELATRLAAAGLAEAFVSLHAATAAVSDAVTGAPGTFARTLAGIDRLTAAGVRVILNFVICAANHHELPAYARLVAARWPAAHATISFVAPSADVVPRDTALIPRYADVLPSLAEALAVARQVGLPMDGFESMCGLPLCLVPEDARPTALPAIAPGQDGGEFVKVTACASCAASDRCWGVRRGYAELHGTAELHPI